MDHSLRRATMVVALGLLASVATQVLYMVLLGGPSPSEPGGVVTHADRARYFTDSFPTVATIWTVELAAFVALAAGALVALSRGAALPSVWAGLVLAGTFNAFQVGIGLSMFQPAVTAGDALEPLFTTVLNGAFFFYFLAKTLVGLAAIGIGAGLARHAGIAARAVGGLAVIAGALAVAVNILALTHGRSLTLPAGASGTVAALALGLAIMMLRSAGGFGRDVADHGPVAPPLDSPARPR